jgi:hypothetical protein
MCGFHCIHQVFDVQFDPEPRFKVPFKYQGHFRIQDRTACQAAPDIQDPRLHG